MNIYYTFAPVTTEELLAEAMRRAGAVKDGAPLPPVLRTANGKPYFGGDLPRFSLTHTAGLTAIAVGEREMGLDAERRTLREFGHIAARLTPAERAEDFLKLWTAKEAYVKFRGGTLAAMLRRLVYENGVLFEDGKPAEAAFRHFALGDFILCLCTQTEECIRCLPL